VRGLVAISLPLLSLCLFSAWVFVVMSRGFLLGRGGRLPVRWQTGCSVGVRRKTEKENTKRNIAGDSVTLQFDENEGV